LTYQDTDADRWGQPPAYEPYNDLEGIDALTGLPDHAFHRNVDKIVLAAAEYPAIKAAIICPPTIYGKGRGVGNTKSRQVYVMANMTLKRGKAPIIGTGKASMDDVHVHDLTDLYIKMVDAALNPKPEVDQHIWGPKEGYLFAEGGYHVWGEVAQWVAEAAHAKGYIKDTTLEVSFSIDPFLSARCTKFADPIKPLDVAEAKEIAGFEAASYGLNSRGYAKRARKYLGWNPSAPSLKEEVPSIVDVEAELLGFKPSKP
jgi:nucleoside-diphosphate-sugar epimerase